MKPRFAAPVCTVLLALAACPSPAPEPAPSPPDQTGVQAALVPLPEEFRADATVMGYDSTGALRVMREGEGEMICLAPNPAEKEFHAACYHNSMEPFMARGRELRAVGVSGGEVDSVRFREVRQGTLALPEQPAALYQHFGGRFDPAAGVVRGGQSLYVVYIPFATGKSTGLSEQPSDTEPWIMFPGTPKAHIMISGKM